VKRKRSKHSRKPERHKTHGEPGEPGAAPDPADGGGASQAAAPGQGRKGPRPLVGDDSRYLEIVLVAVALAALLIRIVYLRADPPLGLSWSQALFTDGARAIDGARNKIMFGEWVTGAASPVFLFYPLSNILAYIIYLAGGVGLVQANLTGVLPGLATLGLVLYYMRRFEGKVAAIVALGVFALPYVYVIYSRTPLLESLQILLLMAAFTVLLRGTPRGCLAAGVLTGAAAFMVKLHAIHFAAVGIVFLLLAVYMGRYGAANAYKLGAFFLAGLGIACAVWALGVYSVDPATVSAYFESNIIRTQSVEYRDTSVPALLGNRLRGFLQVGSGIDGFFHKLPALSLLSAIGLISALSGMARGNRTLRSWEALAAVWFAVLVTALSFLSYRPLRYFIPLVPSMCLLASSVLLRLIRGEPLLHETRPRWFSPVFFLWLLWVLIHLQHDIIFLVLKPHLGGALTAGQTALARYDMSIFKQILILGGVAAAVVFLFGKALRSASWRFRRPTRKSLAVVAVGALVLVNLAKFGDYCANRKYTIVNMAESLERVTSQGVFLVGDCSTTLSLETDFRTMPTYGEAIRQDDREALEEQPITHFLIRFPTLYEYLEKNYPDFASHYVPVSRYELCGRDATVIRYEQWPGYPASYVPTRFEDGMLHLSRGEVTSAYHEFESFLEERPDSYEAMLGMVICLSVMDRADDARAQLDEAIEIAPPGALEYHVYKSIFDALLSEEGAGR
jgi:hypothetical protein